MKTQAPKSSGYITPPRLFGYHTGINILLAALLFAVNDSASASTDTWVGNTSANWSGSTNWSTAPTAGDALVFGVAGTSGTALNNDLTSLSLSGISFSSGASAYTLSGNTITLTGNVSNSSTSLETINFNIAASSTTTYTMTTGGGNITLGGVLSGGGGITTAGSGTLTLAGTNNNYSGITTIVANTTLRVSYLADEGSNSSIGNISASSDTGSSTGILLMGGTLQLAGSTAQSTNRLIRIDTTGTSAIDSSGSGTIAFTSTNSIQFKTPGSRTLALTGTNKGVNSFAIQLTDQATASGNYTNLVKSGIGSWYVTNTNNSYGGVTTISGGILNVASLSDYGVNSSLGNRAASADTSSSIGILLQGGTLQYTGSTAQSTNRQIRIMQGVGSAIDASGSTDSATLSFTYSGMNASLFQLPGSRSLTLTGSNKGANTFAIALTDQDASTGKTSLIKSGVGKWALTGSNTYTGATTVSSGILQIGNGTTGMISSGTTTVSGSATLVFNQANGTGYAGIIVNTGTINMIASGTNILSGNISGSGVFNQTGSGTTILSGSNTYTGATTISAGELDVNGSLSTSSAVTVASGATLGGSGTVGGTVSATNATINGSGLTLGATTLQGTSTLSGYNIASSVTVAGGTTTLTGTTKSIGTLSVAAGATLSTNGTIAGNATVSGLIKGNTTVTGNLSLTSGTLSSGINPGITMVNGNFTMDSTSKLVAEVSGAVAGISYAQVKVSGNVFLAGTLDLSSLSGLTLGETITLIDNTGSGTTTGYFSSIVIDGTSYTATSSSDYTITLSGVQYLLSYASNADGDSYSNDVTLTVVPEPATWAMMVGGIGMLLSFRRLSRTPMD